MLQNLLIHKHFANEKKPRNDFDRICIYVLFDDKNNPRKSLNIHSINVRPSTSGFSPTQFLKINRF